MKTDLFARYPALSSMAGALEDAVNVIVSCFKNGGKLLLCGNGGSNADCEHIAGEMMKGFLKKRPVTGELRARFEALGPEGAALAGRLQTGLPAIALNSPAVSTAAINDLGGDTAFAQQVMGLGAKGDVLIGISTSGNARDAYLAALAAKAKGMWVVGLTGEGGGALAELCDVLLAVPARETYKVQEYHLPVYHALCALTEAALFEA